VFVGSLKLSGGLVLTLCDLSLGDYEFFLTIFVKMPPPYDVLCLVEDLVYILLREGFYSRIVISDVE